MMVLLGWYISVDGKWEEVVRVSVDEFGLDSAYHTTSGATINECDATPEVVRSKIQMALSTKPISEVALNRVLHNQQCSSASQKSDTTQLGYHKWLDRIKSCCA